MINHWKSLDLEITDFNITTIQHHQVKPYHRKPQTLKHVETIKVSDKPTYDTSVESFDLEITGFIYHLDQTPSVETTLSQTPNP